MLALVSLLLLFSVLVFVSVIPQRHLSRKVWLTLPRISFMPSCPWLTNPKLQQIMRRKSSRDAAAYQLPPLKEKSSGKIAMGLRRLDATNWLTLDSKYLSEHTLRCRYITENRSKVLECLPGSETACYELLAAVSSFLSQRFPQHFTITSSQSGPTIQNHMTGESFLCGPNAACPLEVAAKLAMEDFNILMKDQETGNYELLASATLFPAGWKLQERIGTSMENLHAPVPGWQAKLGAHVYRYFDHLSSKNAMERYNLFIQTMPDLFQDSAETENLPEDQSTITAAQIMVRRERQTFTRLEKSEAVCFTVRTYMVPMTDLGDDELKALRSLVRGWEEDVRKYKGWDVWGKALMEWCDGRLGKDEGLGEE